MAIAPRLMTPEPDDEEMERVEINFEPADTEVIIEGDEDSVEVEIIEHGATTLTSSKKKTSPASPARLSRVSRATRNPEPTGWRHM